MEPSSKALTTRQLGEPIASYRQREVTLGQLIAAATVVADGLPEGAQVVNLCSNRFHFLVYFCATLLVGGKSILPPNKQSETITALADRCPDKFRIVLDADLGLPQSLGDAVISVAEIDVGLEFPATSIPEIALDAPIVEVFTSGSTGVPKRIYKTWRILQGTGIKLCERLDVTGELWDLIATVPCQHMYGLETSIIMPLMGNFVCHDETPFYPQDVIQHLQTKLRNVRMVTTPVHLRAVMNSGQHLPSHLKQIISATAPLDDELAQRTEQKSTAEVYEIFGFSEAGSVATRRTVAGPQWQLLSGFSLTPSSPVSLSSEHLPSAELFPDNVEVVDESHFRFLSRSGDHINIGGKRMSLNDLQLKLLNVSGVEDAHLYISDHKVGRPTGFMVTERTVNEVLAELARNVDPVFLPRPLKKLSKIMRNATGKVSQIELDLMKAQCQS